MIVYIIGLTASLLLSLAALFYGVKKGHVDKEDITINMLIAIFTSLLFWSAVFILFNAK